MAPAGHAGRRRRWASTQILWVVATLALCVAHVLGDSNMPASENIPGRDLAFGLEMEFAGLGERMRLSHINNITAENYEAVIGAFAGPVFNDHAPVIEHEVLSVPHPQFPNKFEPRRVRTAAWVDPKGRTWKVTAEYVTAMGVYDGYEVVFPPMTDSTDAEAVAQALWSSGLLTKGEKSATHVHVNGTCLMSGPGDDPTSKALGLANLLVLHEKYEAIIRRLFQTRHFGGSMNRFARSLSDVHPGLIERIAKIARQQRGNLTVKAITNVFQRFAGAEHAFAGVAPDVSVDNITGPLGRFHALRRLWKYHSLNVANLIPLNPGFSGHKTTVEFRAFDLLSAPDVELAIEFCRALVNKACSDAANNVPVKSKGQLPRVPVGGEAAVDLLPHDPQAVREAIVDFLSLLGLDAVRFAPLLDAVREETSESWAESMIELDDVPMWQPPVVIVDPNGVVIDNQQGQQRQRRGTRIGNLVRRGRAAEEEPVIEEEEPAPADSASDPFAAIFADVGRAVDRQAFPRKNAMDPFDEEETWDFGEERKNYNSRPKRRSDDEVWAEAFMALSSLTSCCPNPCKNGGTCIEEDKGISCECRDGFYGPFCEHGVILSSGFSGSASGFSFMLSSSFAQRTTSAFFPTQCATSTHHIRPTATQKHTTRHPSHTGHPRSTHSPPPRSTNHPSPHSTHHPPPHSSHPPPPHSTHKPPPHSTQHPPPHSTHHSTKPSSRFHTSTSVPFTSDIFISVETPTSTIEIEEPSSSAIIFESSSIEATSSLEATSSIEAPSSVEAPSSREEVRSSSVAVKSTETSKAEPAGTSSRVPESSHTPEATRTSAQASSTATPAGSSQPRSTTALSASAKKNAIKVTFANLDQQTFQTQYESGFKNAIAKAVNKALGNGRRRAVVVGSDDVVIIQYAPSGTSLGVIFYVGVMGADGQEVVISADVLLAAVQASLAEIAAALGLTILSVGLSPIDDGGGGGGGGVVPTGSSGGGGVPIGAVVGGAVGGVVLIGGVVGFVVYRKKKMTGSYNVERVRIPGDVESAQPAPGSAAPGTVVISDGRPVTIHRTDSPGPTRSRGSSRGGSIHDVVRDAAGEHATSGAPELHVPAMTEMSA